MDYIEVLCGAEEPRIDGPLRSPSLELSKGSVRGYLGFSYTFFTLREIHLTLPFTYLVLRIWIS